MELATAAVILFLATACLGAYPQGQVDKCISFGDYQVYEQLPVAPSPWTPKRIDHINQDQSFKLRIHLKNINTPSFHQKVFEMSTPGHQSYGQHMTRKEVNSYLAPSPLSFLLVRQWLEEQNVGNITVENDWFVVESTVRGVERLLHTNFEVYENTLTGKSVLRTLSYSLPRSLRAHIDIIAPTIKFSTPGAYRSTLVDWPAEEIHENTASLDGGAAAACNSSITLECIKDLYNLRQFSGSNSSNNQFALAGFLEEYAQHDDLNRFLTLYEPDAVGNDFSTVLVNNGSNTQQNETDKSLNMGEANLDIQYAFLAYPTPAMYISTGGRPPETSKYEVDNEPYLEFLTYLLGIDQPPQTISISYGDSEWSVPESYARTVCDLFSQLAARGVSVLVASGDSGSGSNCNETHPGSLYYTPSFPASCPFVTSVGSTYHISPEIAVSFSGGGFSDIFPRPAYQDQAVTTYLDNADPSFTPYFNLSGRAYPDIAAQGVNFHVFVRGNNVLESGTSASTPIMAAIIALLNGDRIERGAPPLGLLNPWLYENGQAAFTDIVGGKGSGCPQISGSGFRASTGWDPVTGLGTPDFEKLREQSSNSI
ncbi:BgTH12-06208 [Blumeria graminis f. sp. triticale]|uniref:tripeptidyl-peptidase II n=3 Tax=Blumeria graminis TaxID=34373 RepID=A0A061HII2_BLUGR|nr:tripeptidyl-peptidase [Blumeria graminis f. sp. tritici 96224]CAD6504479.1 BgTH12-06208 [Blumeria graminis f. sp. triticale]VDB91387.1 Bgt-3175 [Blumeria graminis f. sp. tritici]